MHPSHGSIFAINHGKGEAKVSEVYYYSGMQGKHYTIRLVKSVSQSPDLLPLSYFLLSFIMEHYRVSNIFLKPSSKDKMEHRPKFLNTGDRWLMESFPFLDDSRRI